MTDSRPAGSRGHVLLAEDEPVNQRVVRLMLEHLGYSVEIVGNGAEAARAAVTGNHDVVLMDREMPVLDGLAAAARIRANETPDRRIPIIALTGATGHEDRARCRAAGMDDYIAKPVSMDALEAAISRNVPPAATGPDRIELDPAIIEPFRELARDGGPDTLRTMHSYLVRDTPEKLRMLRTAAAAKDPGAVASIAHAIRGTMAFVGASEMVGVCRQIEEAMVDRAFDGLEELVASTERCAVLVEKELARIINER
ncbi:MAG: two-component system, sensor histidine kinase and response regulator [Chloroflexota bacterium]|jgi:CheY-like chemotaxis protein|nr:two-component system, sensor histidine kinase and response regulator [Chloroflexota bacterium]